MPLSGGRLKSTFGWYKSACLVTLNADGTENVCRPGVLLVRRVEMWRCMFITLFRSVSTSSGGDGGCGTSGSEAGLNRRRAAGDPVVVPAVTKRSHFL